MTYLGGSLMPPEVLDAMRQAAECFVDLYELQAAVGRRIAELTSERGGVRLGRRCGRPLPLGGGLHGPRHGGRDPSTRGARRAAAGLHHPPRPSHSLRLGDRARRRPTHRDRVGDRHDRGRPGRARSDAKPRGSCTSPELTSRRARCRSKPSSASPGSRDIPVIVDAAAQLPPVENLWAFSAAGADLVLFSGGKGLCGPASTGLVLGSRRYVERFERNAHRASASAGR